jgi:hypothetical protein
LTVSSDRLELVACSLPVAHGILRDRGRAENALRARIPDDWPLPALRGYLPYYVQMLAGDPTMLGWGSGWWCTPPSASSSAMSF